MPEKEENNQTALDALFWREEILQVLYWMDGEGLAAAVPFNRLLSLLNTSPENLLLHLHKNIEAGYLKIEEDSLSENSLVQLTPGGKKKPVVFFAMHLRACKKQGMVSAGPIANFATTTVLRRKTAFIIVPTAGISISWGTMLNRII